MHQPGPVRDSQRVRGRGHHPQRLLHRQRRTAQQVSQGLAVGQFPYHVGHHEAAGLGDLPVVEDPGDLGAGELADSPDGQPEPGFGRRVPSPVGGQHLDRDLGTGAQLDGPPYRSGPAGHGRGAKRDSQPEAAIEARPCHERSHSLSLPEPVTKPLNPRKKDGAEGRITDR